MERKQNLTIGCLAKKLDVCVETIRYYHRIGLLPIPKTQAEGTVRVYTAQHLSLLQFIKRAQRLGFSLDEIRGLITLSDGQHCAAVYQMAQEKLLVLEEKMEEIANMREAISKLTRECLDAKESICPLIEALRQEKNPEELVALCKAQTG